MTEPTYPRDATRLSLERVLGLERENARLREENKKLHDEAIHAHAGFIPLHLRRRAEDLPYDELYPIEDDEGRMSDPVEQKAEAVNIADGCRCGQRMRAVIYWRGRVGRLEAERDEAREARNAALEMAAAKPDQATVDALKQTIGNLDRLLDESRAERDKALEALREVRSESTRPGLSLGGNRGP